MKISAHHYYQSVKLCCPFRKDSNSTETTRIYLAHASADPPVLRSPDKALRFQLRTESQLARRDEVLRPDEYPQDVCALEGRPFSCFSVCSPPPSQSPRSRHGDILGTVTDNPRCCAGSNITVENVATHESHATTSPAGLRRQPSYPGNYSVSAAARGFQNFVVSSVMLSAGDRIRVNRKWPWQRQ